VQIKTAEANQKNRCLKGNKIANQAFQTFWKRPQNTIPGKMICILRGEPKAILIGGGVRTSQPKMITVELFTTPHFLFRVPIIYTWIL